MVILEDLWSGNVIPYERQVNDTGQYAQICKSLCEAEEELLQTFSPEQRKLYDELGKQQLESAAYTDCQTYIHAFKLGAKIMLDVLTDGQMKEV